MPGLGACSLSCITHLLADRHFRSPTLIMERLGTLYGIPREIERWETMYPGRDGVVYKKVECKVWVDEGGEYLMPLRFEAWVERRGLVFGDPIPAFDARIRSEDQYGPIDLRTAPGEVVDPEPEPMEQDPGSPWCMETDGHEGDYFGPDQSDLEEDMWEPPLGDPEDEELPSSEQSGAETD